MTSRDVAGSIPAPAHIHTTEIPMPRKPKPEPVDPPPVVPKADSSAPSRGELWEEFLQLAVHYNVWRQVRLAYEDGQIDIGAADWDRLQDLAGELGVRERTT